MHLVAPLVSGIAGAGDGCARITKRNSTTLATLYSSFEGDPFSSEQLNADNNVLLDAYGRAEVYVDEVCDVYVYDIDGVQQIVFTAGFSAGGIEVRSPSFTGSAYDGSLANKPGLPTTLQQVLDLWLSSDHEQNWGLGLSQPLIVATDPAYGATGNGVTDDTVALQAAIAAAGGGGIVFLPWGKYLVTSALDIGPGITLLGAGNVFAGSGYGTELLGNNITPSVVHARGGSVRNLSISSSGTGQLVFVDPFETTDVPTVLDNVSFSGAGYHVFVSPNASVTMRGCRLDGGQLEYILAQTAKRVLLDNCRFRLPISYPAIAVVRGDNMYLRDCVFDGSATNTGIFSYVRYDASDKVGSVLGCTFLAPGFATLTAAIHLGTVGNNSRFFEDDNNFALGVKAYTYTASSHANCDMQLWTRERRGITISDSSSSVTIPTDQYGTIVVQSSHASPTLTGTLPPRGARGTVIFYHPSGGAGTAQPTTNFFGSTAATTANTSSHAWDYVCQIANAALRMLITVDGKNLGNGAP